MKKCPEHGDRSSRRRPASGEPGRENAEIPAPEGVTTREPGREAEATCANSGPVNGGAQYFGQPPVLVQTMPRFDGAANDPSLASMEAVLLAMRLVGLSPSGPTSPPVIWIPVDVPPAAPGKATELLDVKAAPEKEAVPIDGRTRPAQLPSQRKAQPGEAKSRRRIEAKTTAAGTTASNTTKGTPRGRAASVRRSTSAQTEAAKGEAAGSGAAPKGSRRKSPEKSVRPQARTGNKEPTAKAEHMATPSAGHGGARAAPITIGVATVPGSVAAVATLGLCGGPQIRDAEEGRRRGGAATQEAMASQGEAEKAAHGLRHKSKARAAVAEPGTQRTMCTSFAVLLGCLLVAALLLLVVDARRTDGPSGRVAVAATAASQLEPARAPQTPTTAGK